MEDDRYNFKIIFLTNFKCPNNKKITPSVKRYNMGIFLSHFSTLTQFGAKWSTFAQINPNSLISAFFAFMNCHCRSLELERCSEGVYNAAKHVNIGIHFIVPSSTWCFQQVYNILSLLSSLKRIYNIYYCIWQPLL